MSGIDTRAAYVTLILLVVVERLFELRLAKRNFRAALARGGVEFGAAHYPWMVALHTAFLIACATEVWLAERPFRPLLGAVMLALLAAVAVVRLWVIRSLGERWTTRVVCVPGEPAVRRGPYQYLRHPNYVAVMVETFALPLVHGAWISALVFTAANAVLLRERIRVEEAALERHADYARLFRGGARRTEGDR